MKFGSLFSGIGGFDLGFEQAGLECAWQVEIDKDCNRVLTRQFPNVQKYADVTECKRMPAVDVLCGGFPCQDLSVAGKREGLAGKRSGLWFQFLRVIEINQPRIVCIENVPGLHSSDDGRDFAVIIRGLVECGYCVGWRVFDAQYDGVAQRRRRVFIIGSLGSGSCAEILFESESVPWNPPTRREARPRIASTIRGGSNGGSAHGKPNGSDEREMIIAATLDQRGRGPTDAVMMNLQVTHALRSEGADASEDGTGRSTPIVVAATLRGGASGGTNHGKRNGSDRMTMISDVAKSVRANTGGIDREDMHTLIAFSSKDHGADAGTISPTLRAQNFKDSHIKGGGQVAIAFDTYNQRDCGDKAQALSSGLGTAQHNAVAFQEAQTGCREYENAGSLRANAPGTQPTGTLLRLPFGVRRLTPQECERLQGFPDDWTRWDSEGKEISDSARYRMLGNAVCVTVAKWIGQRIEATA